MAKIITNSIPRISITRELDEESDTPALNFFNVSMNANDWALDDEAMAEETFAKVSMVLFDPSKGNPTDNADADCQELFDVSTAFYYPDGDLSTRALARGDFDDSSAAPMVYIRNIELLKGYEKTGQLEAGLALALRQIGKDYGCEFIDQPLMVAAYEKQTLRHIEGDNLYAPSAKSAMAPLGKSIKDALKMLPWVEEGQTFASETGHGASAGVLLSDASNQMLGFGQALEGNVLLGCPSFDFGCSFEERNRSEKEIEKWTAAREKAIYGKDAPAVADEKPASKPSLSEAVAKISELLDQVGQGEFSAEEAKQARLLANKFMDKVIESSLDDFGMKLKAKRGKGVAQEAISKDAKPKK